MGLGLAALHQVCNNIALPLDIRNLSCSKSTATAHSRHLNDSLGSKYFLITYTWKIYHKNRGMQHILYSYTQKVALAVSNSTPVSRNHSISLANLHLKAHSLNHIPPLQRSHISLLPLTPPNLFHTLSIICFYPNKSSLLLSPAPIPKQIISPPSSTPIPKPHLSSQLQCEHTQNTVNEAC